MDPFLKKRGVHRKRCQYGELCRMSTLIADIWGYSTHWRVGRRRVGWLPVPSVALGRSRWWREVSLPRPPHSRGGRATCRKSGSTVPGSLVDTEARTPAWTCWLAPGTVEARADLFFFFSTWSRYDTIKDSVQTTWRLSHDTIEDSVPASWCLNYDISEELALI